MSLRDFLFPDRRFREEIAEWQRTGQFPEEVVRGYASDRIRGRELERMMALGYRVTHQENIFARGGKYARMDAGVQVTYSRNPFQ